MKLKNYIVLAAIIIVIGALVCGGVFFSIKKKRDSIVEKLNLTKNQLESKDYQAALKTLAELYPDVKNSKAAADVISLLAQTSMKLEKFSEAKQYAEELLKKFPKGEIAQKANLILGEIILKQSGNLEEAESYFKKIIDDKSNEELMKQAEYFLAELKHTKGNLEDAKELFENLYQQKISQELKEQIEDSLGKTNISLLYSRGLMEGDMLYDLEKGDSVYKLARKFKISQTLLMKCNGISDPNRLSIGMRIKIPKVDFSIRVNKSDNTLTLYNNGKFFKKYKVRTGKYDHLTPTGTYKINNKKENPTWADPKTHKVYQPGDPENELGTRWMAFSGDYLGIHGTVNPESVGQSTSNGCIGMLKEDVEELYDLVSIGTPIEIVGKIPKSEDGKTQTNQ